MRKSVVFLGSKPIGYACLKHLIQMQSELNIRLSGILTNDNLRFNPGLSLLQLAQESNIPVFKDPDHIPPCDFLISVQYHQILKSHHIQRARLLAINLHMAPLPEYRGCNQFSFALLDQKKEFGTTLHVMDEKIDHGAILAEKRFPIPERCWVDELYQLTLDASMRLFEDSIAGILRGDIMGTPQEKLEGERGTQMHYRNEINAIKQIQLNWPEEQIDRHLRATFMPGFEPPFTYIQGEKIYLSRTWSKNG